MTISPGLPKWVGLEDAEAQHREAPRTFSIPRAAQRRALTRGDRAKLIFLADPPSAAGHDAERMWVQVLEARPGFYIGALDNVPSFIADLQPGARVEFAPEHVCAIELPGADPLPYGKGVVVSRLVAGEGAWPGELRRYPPPEPGWSGWFVLAGSEGMEFRRDRSNFIPMSVDELLYRFRILDSVLDEPVGTRWVWDPDSLEYEPASSSDQQS